MIYVLPGMGADSSMFRDHWRRLEDCILLDWPAYRGETTLQAIAQRVVNEAGIVTGDVVVGHSLGGMVGCEIAALCPLKRLILVGSAKRREEVGRLLTAMHPLAACTPFRLAQAVAARLPGNPYSMFARSDPGFLRATCRAVFEWQGLGESRVDTRRIHGRHDWVIPLPDDVDQVLDGGHLIPITHPGECVGFVRSALQAG